MSRPYFLKPQFNPPRPSTICSAYDNEFSFFHDLDFSVNFQSSRKCSTWLQRSQSSQQQPNIESNNNCSDQNELNAGHLISNSDESMKQTKAPVFEDFELFGELTYSSEPKLKKQRVEKLVTNSVDDSKSFESFFSPSVTSNNLKPTQKLNSTNTSRLQSLLQKPQYPPIMPEDGSNKKPLFPSTQIMSPSPPKMKSRRKRSPSKKQSTLDFLVTPTSPLPSSSTTSSSSPTKIITSGDQLDGFCTMVEDEGVGSEVLELIGNSPHFSFCVLFSDLSSSHASTSTRHCTPKAHCGRWSCSCDKHVRSCHLTHHQMAGLLISLPSNHRFFLSSSTPSLISSIFTQTPSTRKIAFHAQIALMPLISLCGEEILAIDHLICPQVGYWLLDTDTPLSDLELHPLLSHLPPPFSSSSVDPSLAIQASDSSLVSRVKGLFGELERVTELGVRICGRLDEEGAFGAYEQLEVKLIPLLGEMELIGISIDLSILKSIERRIEERIGFVEDEVATLSNTHSSSINLSSPEQVASLLYSTLKLPAPPTPKSKKHPSTSESVLERLKEKHPVVPLILQYRTLSKVITSYIHPLRTFATKSPKSHQSSTTTTTLIKAHWNHCAVRTGRLSCTHPALQTIPNTITLTSTTISEEFSFIPSPTLTSSSSSSSNIVNNSNHKLNEEEDDTVINLRSAFVPNYDLIPSTLSDEIHLVMMSADYSQIEMRVLAEVCGDPTMFRLFEDGGDIYSHLAAIQNKKNISDISKVERNKAKTVALGVIYGMGSAAVGRRLGITEREAGRVVTQFLSTFHLINKFVEETKKFGEEHGFVTTMTGRRRHVRGISSQSSEKKAQAKRQSVNSVIQGTASDLMKLAMILIRQEMRSKREEHPHVHILLQIHDELVFQLPDYHVPRFTEVVKECMEEKVRELLGLRVPLLVNIQVGENWGDLKD